MRSDVNLTNGGAMLDAANASWQEILWSAGALLGLLFTIGMAVWAWTRFRVVQNALKDGQAVRWGPRWNLTLGLFVAMVLFGLGWLGYLSIGVIAMLTPPPTREVNQDAADWFAWILVGMEVAHALGQAVLLLAFMSLSGLPRWVLRVVVWRPA